jgi:membrane protease YdiL (CAAX protease family)
MLVAALTAAPFTIPTACLTAFGEEVAWRGSIWPLLRGRFRFLAASAVIGGIWLLHHVPLILTGDYGTVSGLPAFTLGIVGFVLFIGVITDRSRSIWPSVVAHGGWHALVAHGLADTKGAAAFTGAGLVGEFGWINGVGMLALGVAAAVWHVRSGRGGTIPPGPSREPAERVADTA